MASARIVLISREQRKQGKAVKIMCPWCTDPDAEDWDESLCRVHEAEYEGLSVSELDRRDSEQYSEYIDCYGG